MPEPISRLSPSSGIHSRTSGIPAALAWAEIGPGDRAVVRGVEGGSDDEVLGEARQTSRVWAASITISTPSSLTAPLEWVTITSGPKAWRRRRPRPDLAGPLTRSPCSASFHYRVPSTATAGRGRRASRPPLGEPAQRRAGPPGLGPGRRAGPPKRFQVTRVSLVRDDLPLDDRLRRAAARADLVPRLVRQAREALAAEGIGARRVAKS